MLDGALPPRTALRCSAESPRPRSACTASAEACRRSWGRNSFRATRLPPRARPCSRRSRADRIGNSTHAFRSLRGRSSSRARNRRSPCSFQRPVGSRGDRRAGWRRHRPSLPRLRRRPPESGELVAKLRRRAHWQGKQWARRRPAPPAGSPKRRGASRQSRIAFERETTGGTEWVQPAATDSHIREHPLQRARVLLPFDLTLPRHRSRKAVQHRSVAWSRAGPTTP